MVIYDLACEFGHSFEGWFKNSDDLVAQQNNGLLTCPYCESSMVSKKIAAPKVGKKSNAGSTSLETVPALSEGSHSIAVGGNSYQAGTPKAFAELQKMLGKVHDYIDSNFTDVGNRFTEEAISIHKGEKEPANIRGTASKEQLKELVDEGVNALPIPKKPIDKDKLN